MYATRNPEGAIQVSRPARSIQFGLTAGALIVGLAVASLLVGLIRSDNQVRYPAGGCLAAAQPYTLPIDLIWSDSLARYPGAGRLAAAQLDAVPTGIISQYSAYQTADDLPQVLSWYARYFGLSHDEPQGDNCITMIRVDTHLFLQQSLAVTLCSHPTRTLVFVIRRLAVRQ